MSSYFRVHEVAKKLKVSPSTVRSYVERGLLECDRTPTNQRVFTQDQIDSFLGVEHNKAVYAFYARSSTGTQTHLDNQLSDLESHFGKPVFVFQDKGSGLNEKRAGLKSLLDHAQQGDFNKLAIVNKDRLTRFGFTYLERMLNDYGVDVVVLHDKPNPSPQEELLTDFMSLVASFSGKFYRLRSIENQKKLVELASKQLKE